MSIHPSLTASKGKSHRSVMKRYERVEKLKKDGNWADDSSAFGLPKVKVVRMKLKKSKAAAKPTEDGADAKK